MRETLFRGKRVYNGEWIEGFYACLGEKIHYILTGKLALTYGTPRFEAFEVIPETVGQFTGLTDKNGRKIFEGDIIAFINNDGEKSLYAICWLGIKWAAKWLEPTRLDADLYDDMDCWNPNRWAVIGNRWDNLELLGRAKEDSAV